MKLRVQRGSEQFDASICLSEEPPGLATLADMLDASDNFIPEIGIVGLSVSSSVQKWLPDLRRPQGVLVVSANSEGDYSASGLERGDVIYEINRQVVAKVAELRFALRQAKKAGNAVLLVERSGHLVYVAVEVD